MYFTGKGISLTFQVDGTPRDGIHNHAIYPYNAHQNVHLYLTIGLYKTTHTESLGTLT